MNITKLAILFVILGFMSSATFAQKRSGNSPCKTYFMVVEQDSVTVNLAMVGLNDPQMSWYKKNGKEFPSICLVNADASGKRVAANTGSNSPAVDSYIDSIVGTSPLYLIAWEEHKVFVPDSDGGHNAWSANGVLSRWDYEKKDFVPVGPLHDTNRTIFTSSSTSLLKAGLKEIESRSK